jgi:DNA-binding NarL/FixJ family response regulator
VADQRPARADAGRGRLRGRRHRRQRGGRCGARRAGAARPRADGHIRLRGPVDGIEAAREIADRFGIRSLFVSAHGSDPATVARGSSVSPAGWLPKPFTEAELLRAVRAALSLP